MLADDSQLAAPGRRPTCCAEARVGHPPAPGAAPRRLPAVLAIRRRELLRTAAADVLGLAGDRGDRRSR